MCKGRTKSYAICFLSIFFFSFHLIAQDIKDSSVSKTNPFNIWLSYQLLRSTHATIFNGGSVDGDYIVSPHFGLGLGVQYAATKLHPDNGWILTNLHLLPVYANTIYTFYPTHRLQPYLHTEEGISFNHYNKLDTMVAPSSYKVSEEGLYLSGNMGVDFVFRKHLKAFTEVGYKGYKHSANDLDANPHGVTARIGIEL